MCTILFQITDVLSGKKYLNNLTCKYVVTHGTEVLDRLNTTSAVWMTNIDHVMKCITDHQAKSLLIPAFDEIDRYVNIYIL